MARDHGVRTVEVRVSGPGSGRESAIRALGAAGIEVRNIKDATPDSAQWVPSAEAQKSVKASLVVRRWSLANPEFSNLLVQSGAEF